MDSAAPCGGAGAPAAGPPVILLGVSRSGTTLLKEMLDGHSQLAIPTESYFLPQLWDRHGERPDRAAFLDDLERLPRLTDWGVSRPDFERWMPERPSFAQAAQAVYQAYAEARGKPRFGDKTPSYMQRLDVLERAFPGALYVHLVRDGRDAALSFVAMTRKARLNPARPRSVPGFAVQWRREVEGARRFGAEAAAGRYREVRYEDLVADPEAVTRRICTFLGLDFEPAMLDYHRSPPAATLQDHPRLAEPPKLASRRWRERMPPAQTEVFEAIAGELLAELGYERAHPAPSPGSRARATATSAAINARVAVWSSALAVVRRTPIWRLRQIHMRRTFQSGASP